MVSSFFIPFILAQPVFSGFNATKIEIDTGSLPIYSTSLNINDNRSNMSSQILVWQDASPNSKSADENEMDSLSFSVTAENGFFKLNITATPGPIAGIYVINYILL